MKRRAAIIATGLALIAIVVWWLSKSGGEKAEPPRSTVAVSTPREVRTNAPLAGSEPATNRVSVSPIFLSELNRFIAAAKPYGGLEQIKPEDVIAAETNRGRFMLETKTHLADFVAKDLAVPRLHHFIVMPHASRPLVATPEGQREAMAQWYKATGKWSAEEALAETYRIMEQLGIKLAVSRHEVNAQELPMKNPQGETVLVTPFYQVKLFNTNNTMSIDAEFRVGESGPGRLTMWWANVR